MQWHNLPFLKHCYCQIFVNIDTMKTHIALFASPLNQIMMNYKLQYLCIEGLLTKGCLYEL